MVEFLDFVADTNKADTSEAAFELYRRAMASIGFDRLIFSLMTDHAVIDKKAGHGILLNYPEDWMKHYIAKGYEQIDPVRKEAYRTAATFAWAELPQRQNFSRPQKKLMAEAEDAHFYNGIGIPLWSGKGALAGVGAACSSDGLDAMGNADVRSHATLLSQQFYLRYLSIEQSNKESMDNHEAIELSIREKEVLMWAARGKTKVEIADLMKLSDHTIHSYTRAALKKLGANNLVVGILKAIQLGMIHL